MALSFLARARLPARSLWLNVRPVSVSMPPPCVRTFIAPAAPPSLVMVAPVAFKHTLRYQFTAPQATPKWKVEPPSPENESIDTGIIEQPTIVRVYQPCKAATQQVWLSPQIYLHWSVVTWLILGSRDRWLGY